MQDKKKPRKRRKKQKAKRKTFLLDHATLTDLGVVQAAARATSASEAVRVSVMKMAELIRHVSKGSSVQIITAEGAPLVVDIPHTGER